MNNSIKKQIELIRNYNKKRSTNGLLPIELEIETDIYTQDGVEEYSDNDAISIREQGFMVGYLAS